MKKVFLSIAVSLFFTAGFSQNISKITITGSGQVDVFAFGLDENVQVYVTPDGHISKWGFDRFIGFMENYNNELVPYVGRVEYYTQNDDEAIRGKVKYIGRTLITYYSSYENEALKGKLKAIGSIGLEYYLTFDDAAFSGNIKSLGRQTVTWYPSFENADFRGKLKSVGPTVLTYYGSFEDKAFRGKIKSIDRYNITYYSSFEQFSGNMKSGLQIMNSGGIKYYVRNF